MLLILELAARPGIKKALNEEEAEDEGLAYAIAEGRTGKFVDTDDFLKRLTPK